MNKLVFMAAMTALVATGPSLAQQTPQQPSYAQRMQECIAFERTGTTGMTSDMARRSCMEKLSNTGGHTDAASTAPPDKASSPAKSPAPATAPVGGHTDGTSPPAKK